MNPMKGVLVSLLLLNSVGFATEHIAKNPQELHAALLKLADGDTLLIGPGEYPGGHHVSGIARLTIRGLESGTPPVFVGGGNAWHFSRCSGLTLISLTTRGQTGNGINLDDGGDREIPVEGITLAHLVIEDVGPQGNHDAIKCSGLVGLTIRNCIIAGWGGQGIDLVGCHRSLITDCRFIGKEGFSASAGIQMKGGTSEVIVEKCVFKNAGERPLNLGGSTGLEYFRPAGVRHEAAKLIVRDNVIEGSACAAAFVGVDGAEFTKNTILFPERWIFRILQETTEPGFVPCRNVRVSGNRIVFRRAQIRSDVNIGGNTAPETFVFEWNYWFAEDRPGNSKPQLPVEERSGSYGIDPRVKSVLHLDPALRESSLQIPVHDEGADLGKKEDRPDQPDDRNFSCSDKW